jgi:hypothetical protein
VISEVAFRKRQPSYSARSNVIVVRKGASNDVIIQNFAIGVIKLAREARRPSRPPSHFDLVGTKAVHGAAD